MLSWQAKTVRWVLRASSRKAPYTLSQITADRRRFNRNMCLLFPATGRHVSKREIGGVPVEEIAMRRTERAIIYVHGGGFMFGSARGYRQHVKRVAQLCNARVYSVDYTLAPKAICPQALDEIQRAWTALMAGGEVRNQHVTFMGDSAGANLVLASLLRLRDAHIELPAAAVLLSPALDGTFSGESYAQNAAADPVLNRGKMDSFITAYIGAASRQDPYISPIFAHLHGLPPLLVHVGSNEMLLSDSEAICEHAQRDGVRTELFVGSGLWHIWHLFAAFVPEARQAIKSVAGFVKRST